jgi:hypothetical protein
MTRPQFTNWRKPSRSEPDGNCVAFATTHDGAVGVRDSKDPTGPVLTFNADDWRALLAHARNGDLDA